MTPVERGRERAAKIAETKGHADVAREVRAGKLDRRSDVRRLIAIEREIERCTA